MIANKTARFARACLLAPALAALVIAAPAAAEDETGFDVEGSVRVRYETFDGGFRPGGVESDDAVLLRSVLRGTYTGDGFRLGGMVQDSRAYANDLATPLGTADINALELVELYASVDIADHISVTLGRQTMNLGSKRFIGTPSFRNTANGFTGARLDWTGGDDGQLTAFYMLPQDRRPTDKQAIVDNAVHWDRESDDLRFWGLFYQRPHVGPFTAEAYVYALQENDSAALATRNRHLVTPGVRLFTAPAQGHADMEVEAAWQTGNIRASRSASAARLDVDAFTLHAGAGYTFTSPVRPRISVFYDLATGDDPDSASYNTFDPLFGPRYADWGPSGLFGPLGRNNIRSLGAQGEVRFSARVDAQLLYRRNWLDSRTDAFSKTGVVDAAGLSGRDAGSQLQGRLRWWIVPGLLRQETGGGWLAKGRFFDLAPNDPGFGDTHYGYTALEVTF